MTPRQGFSGSMEHACSVGVASILQKPRLPSFSVRSGHHDSASVRSTVDDLEAKILERVSQLTIETADNVSPAEVSFTVDDLGETTRTTTTPPTMGSIVAVASPIRPRSKRPPAASNLLFQTPPGTRLGPRSCKKRRTAGTLDDCPRLPCSPCTTTTAFESTIYDDRLEQLVSREEERARSFCQDKMTSTDFVCSPPTVLQHTLPALFEHNFFQSEPLTKRSHRLYQRSRRQGRRVAAPDFPCLSPKKYHLTPLETLAVSIEASPILSQPLP